MSPFDRRLNLFVLDRKSGQEIVVELEDGRQILIALLKIDGTTGSKIGVSAEKSIKIRKAEDCTFFMLNGRRTALIPNR